MLREFVASVGLGAENMGRSPTYQSGESSSVIDFTFSRMIAPHRIRGWKVDEDCFLNSDHNYICYEVTNMTTEHPLAWDSNKRLGDEEMGILMPRSPSGAQRTRTERARF